MDGNTPKWTKQNSCSFHNTNSYFCDTTMSISRYERSIIMLKARDPTPDPPPPDPTYISDPRVVLLSLVAVEGVREDLMQQISVPKQCPLYQRWSELLGALIE